MFKHVLVLFNLFITFYQFNVLILTFKSVHTSIKKFDFLVFGRWDSDGLVGGEVGSGDGA